MSPRPTSVPSLSLAVRPETNTRRPGRAVVTVVHTPVGFDRPSGKRCSVSNAVVIARSVLVRRVGLVEHAQQRAPFGLLRLVRQALELARNLLRDLGRQDAQPGAAGHRTD